MTQNAHLRLMDEDWDILMVLDACQYPYFEKVYRKYFSGNLEKRISPGSCTLEWCEKSFPEYYPDVVYVSGNPYISSARQVKGFSGGYHFSSVIDVWAFGWSEQYGTVLPDQMNRSASKAMRKYPGKRFIVHYMQPHEPYIVGRFSDEGFPAPFTAGPLLGLQGHQHGLWREKMTNYLSFILFKAQIVRNPWVVREKLRLPPANPMDVIRRKYGIAGLREAYTENLEVVLWYVARLCREVLRNNQEARIMITADHGELLGEGGRFSHYRGMKDPLLIEIPWFMVKGVNQLPSLQEMVGKFDLSWAGLERQKLEGRLRRLRRAARV